MLIAALLTMVVLIPTVALVAVGTVTLIRATRYVDDSPRCLRCGYDLRHRATDSATCSECGEALAQATQGVTTDRRLLICGLLLLTAAPLAFAVLALFAYLWL